MGDAEFCVDGRGDVFAEVLAFHGTAPFVVGFPQNGTARNSRALAVEPIELLGMESARDLWWTMFGVAAATFLQPLIGGHEGDLHPFTKELMAAREEESATTYQQFLGAWVDRDRLRSKLLRQMQRHRVLVCPVASIPAFRHGERSWTIDGKTIQYPQPFVYSQIFNLLGNPAAVVPVGQSPDGLPIGVQIVGRPFEDELVLSVAAKIEQALGGWKAPPEL